MSFKESKSQVTMPLSILCRKSSPEETLRQVVYQSRETYLWWVFCVGVDHKAAQVLIVRVLARHAQ